MGDDYMLMVAMLAAGYATMGEAVFDGDPMVNPPAAVLAVPGEKGTTGAQHRAALQIARAAVKAAR